MSEANAPGFGVLAQLQTLLISTDDVVSFLNELALVSTRLQPEADLACGITARYDRSLLTVASSDSRAERLDETQYRHGDGPCLTALETGQTIIVDDLEHDGRWPAYTEQASKQGLRCSMSVPLIFSGTVFAAMNLYSFDRPHLFDDDLQQHYQLFATQAAMALRVITRQATDGALLVQFEEALNSRTTIDQAMGILIARHHIDADQAFDLLRQQSQVTNTRLRDVAATLLTEATGKTPRIGRPFTLN